MLRNIPSDIRGRRLCLSPAQLCGPLAHASEPERRFAAPPHGPCALQHPPSLHGHILSQALLTCHCQRCARHRRRGSQEQGPGERMPGTILGAQMTLANALDSATGRQLRASTFLSSSSDRVGRRADRRQREPGCGFPIDAAGGLLGSCSAVLWSHASAGRGSAAGVRSVCVPPVLLSMRRQVELSCMGATVQ